VTAARFFLGLSLLAVEEYDSPLRRRKMDPRVREDDGIKANIQKTVVLAEA
jgi:hypothetical protein